MRSRALPLLLSLGAALAACGSRQSPPEPQATPPTAGAAAESPTPPPPAAVGEGTDADLMAAQAVLAAARVEVALGRSQSPEFADRFAATAAGSGPIEVRRAALFALGQMGLAEGAVIPEVATKTAKSLLAAADPTIVAGAVEALGKLATAEVVALVTPLLHHADPQVRAEAAMALFRVRFVPVWRKQVETPPALPSTATAALISALGDPDPAVRIAVAHGFSRFGEPTAVAALANALNDSDELVRLFAARGLGRSKSAAGIAPLAARLNDPSTPVRTELVLALAALAQKDPDLERYATEPALQVRAAWARLFGQATSADSIRTLRGLEGDPSPSVRAAAIEAMAGRLGAEYAPSIETYLENERWTTRAAAARAAATLGDAAIALLSKGVDDKDARVQAAALEAATKLGAVEGVDQLIERGINSPDLAVRGTAVSALAEREHPNRLVLLKTAYANSVGVEWIEVREEIANILSKLDAGAALLRRIAKEDPAPSVRRRAITALTKRGARIDAPPAAEPTPQLPFQVETFTGPNPVVVLETSKGNIRIECLAHDAPVHVSSFLALVRRNFYDGLAWHRVVPNFVIQGGDPRGDGWGGPGYTLADEINQHRFVRGAVGMPKAGKDTGGCQIFITHIPTPHLDGNYTVFGIVTAGLDVIDQIEVGDTIVRARVLDPEIVSPGL